MLPQEENMLNRIEELLATYEDKHIDRRQLIGALF